MKALVVAATHSGSGKTTLTLGLMAAMKRRGLRVAPFKIGPDFIDPGHHSQVTGTQSRNLDGWMLSQGYNLKNFSHHATHADLAVIEGVMGLFDGYDGKSEAGSSAQMAKWLGASVLLVVDARSMARSAAAIVKGFEHFDEDLDFTGVIFNRVGSPRHLTYLTDALEGHTTMPCFGGVLRKESIAIPERHLGLVTQEDHQLSEAFLRQLADMVEESIDLDRLLDALPQIAVKATDDLTVSPEASVTRIGVARDAAFCFYYPENIELLQKNGADIQYFSPISDTTLPGDLDGLYFGGGYPEMYARQLAANINLRKAIKSASDGGMPIYGECGGLMYLCETIGDIDGNKHSMTGCLPFATRMLPRLKRLGYREITLMDDSPLGTAGKVIRGHEFHYSEIINEARSVPTCYAVTDRNGSGRIVEGYRINRTLGSYIHLHWGSCPEAAQAFVAACHHYRQERNFKP